MNFRFFLLLLLFAINSQAQLFINYKEYHFVNDYNLALTGRKVPDGEDIKKANGLISPSTKEVLLKENVTDAVYLEPLNYANPAQVWIVEYFSSVCNNTFYHTIKNKQTGEYLTVVGYDAANTNMSNLRQTGYKLLLKPLKRNGPDDISSNQKWRFSNLDETFTSNGYYRSMYPTPYVGRTSAVSMKNFLFEFCKLSTFSFDVTYKQGGKSVGIQTQMADNTLTLSYDNAKFNIIPANPVTLITLKNITNFRCPTQLLRGDREFGGQVNMRLKLELELNSTRTAINLKVFFRAEEPKGDYSTTELSWSEKVYDAPYGVKIKSIISYSTWDYAFSHHLNYNSFTTLNCEFIRFCDVIGDTLGDDISTDNNCGDDTRVGNFVFNKVAVIFE